MKNKLKKVFKSRIFLCLLTAFIAGTVSVYAVTYFPSNQVTYDNSSSKLNSTNVQGAIDELYNTCSSAVSSGNYIYYSSVKYINGGSSYGYPEIYRMSINGGNPTRIYIGDNDNSDVESMYVTKDYIYFSLGSYSNGDSFGYPEIYRMSINGGAATRIYIDSDNRNSSVESMYVTKDYIYFSLGSYSNGDSFGYPEIYRMSINGGTATRIYIDSDNRNSNIDSIFIK